MKKRVMENGSEGLVIIPGKTTLSMLTHTHEPHDTIYSVLSRPVLGSSVEPRTLPHSP